MAVVDGEFDSWRARGDGTARENLTAARGLDSAPRWARQSRVIAFDSNRAGNDDVYVMAANGSRARPLTREPSRESSPAVSPDGTRIAFASNRDGSDAKIPLSG
ncbi:MAG: TolB family protein [bacterium]